ncbi:FKBP-type peptidyl-prolyl cis-trans isomerase [Phenylobacterium sp.]|uniref:FKBP-type peptidyl-prolyl cis-trans isomerase n=1 Tax=Phenylobacterium sp. TaxID=1871053 RepID=UPI002C38E34F|nr:FKBP-type peptidyl-prolyl cis-trans isomerase [Phenylobacterium sp.]HLZ75612.1 FKBP-type peptidyl-prolyl cis-trans isomerase [Phenylobacterium sp.]
MTRRLAAFAFALAAAWGVTSAAGAQAPDQSGETVSLPGIRYSVLAAGPATGAHPTRADSVTMRYIGRLEGGEIFSTSPGDGTGVSTFAVNGVIPGMSAALQLMRPGDHWRITMPPYLAYGPGRPFNTPAPAGAAGQAIQKRGIPPQATLIFDVELVSIAPPKQP